MSHSVSSPASPSGAERSLLEGMLVDLLRFGLFGGAAPSLPAGLDWEGLMRYGQEQAVTALLFDALQRLPAESRPPRSVLLHWASLTQHIEMRYQRHAEAAGDLQQAFSHRHPERGTRPLPVVKGLRVAAAYPVPSHREFGDIDLFSERHTDCLRGFLEERGVAVDDRDRRHLSFLYEGQLFEAHRYLLYEVEDRRRFDQLVARLGLTPEMHALFVAAHLERHAVFFHEAVRWRNLLDWAMLLQSTRPDGSPNAHCIDYARFSDLAADFSFGRFADLLTHYICRRFALPLPATRFTPSPAALEAFEAMYVDLPPRHAWALVRVARRVKLYLRYNAQYKEIYGMSMFRRFYFANLLRALKQLLLFQHREART